MSTDRFTQNVFPRITSSQTELEIDRARARGYAAGHAEGIRAADVAAQKQRDRIEAERQAQRIDVAHEGARAVAILEAAAQSLAHREKQLLAAAKAHLERLAVELAEAVVARELASSDHSARNALHRALSVVEPHDVRAVRLHPHDIDVLHRLELPPTPLVADEALAPGDAVAVLDDGTVDARLGTAFDRARSALTEGES